MSVLATVKIGPGLARRNLVVSLESSPTLDERGRRDHDEIGTYSAILTGRQPPLTATFQHRYGDDVFTLIAKAADALRSTHSVDYL